MEEDKNKQNFEGRRVVGRVDHDDGKSGRSGIGSCGTDAPMSS